jgi:ppGpp synthetase/RelA/SpoT-type nucleotidyltranferase
MTANDIERIDWHQRYLALLPSLSQFSGRLELLVRDVLIRHDIPFHVVESRAKNTDSFLEKITRPGKSYIDPLQEITDLVGLRIILYYPSDVDLACAILRDQFTVDEDNSVDKRTELASDQFGYASVHLVCKISDNRRHLLEWAPFSGFTFEIQTRTVLQHAWASISHALQYKQESDVPDQFKRRLNRLAGLLELADAEFLSLKEQRLTASAEAASKIHRNDLSIKLDSLSIKEYLSTSEIVSLICKAAAENRFSVSHTGDASQLWAVSSFIKLQTVAELDELLKRSFSFATHFFSEFARKNDAVVTSGDADHWVSVLLVAAKHKSIDKGDLEKIVSWSESYNQSILSTAEAVVPNLAK